MTIDGPAVIVVGAVTREAPLLPAALQAWRAPGDRRRARHWSEWLVDQIAGNDEVPRRLHIPRSAAAGSSRFALILPCESLDDLSAGPAAEGIADGVTIDDRDERLGCE
jgi:hypothetical protein